jgi:hypothetical protein
VNTNHLKGWLLLGAGFELLCLLNTATNVEKYGFWVAFLGAHLFFLFMAFVLGVFLLAGHYFDKG